MDAEFGAGEPLNDPTLPEQEGKHERDICQDDEEGNCESYLEMTR